MEVEPSIKVTKMFLIVIEMIKFNNVDSSGATIQIMLKSEIQYLDRILQSLLEDFKQ